MGINHTSYNTFVDELDNNFSLQINKGKEEWIKSEVFANKGSDFKQSFQIGQLAYQFANGFMLFDYEVIL